MSDIIQDGESNEKDIKPDTESKENLDASVEKEEKEEKVVKKPAKKPAKKNHAAKMDVLFSFRIPAKLMNRYRAMCTDNAINISQRIRRYIEKDVEHFDAQKKAEKLYQDEKIRNIILKKERLRELEVMLKKKQLIEDKKKEENKGKN